MWTKNSIEFCRNWGLNAPIIQAPMAGGPSSPSLVSAVSNAGCLGSIGAGYLTPEKLQEEISSVTAQLFSVNVFVPPNKIHKKDLSLPFQKGIQDLVNELGLKEYSFNTNYRDCLDQQLEVVIENKVPILSFAFGVLSKEQIASLKQNLIKVIGTATTVEEAKVLEKAGCDAIVVQGFEAGGHRGGFLDFNHQGIGLFALLPQVLDAVSVPSIAAGGIMDGRGIAAALVMGASAVQLGTAFLSTKESGATNEWKQSLLNSNDTSTKQTKLFSGKLARVIKNKFISELVNYENEVADYPIQNELTKVLRTKAKELVNPDFQSLYAGQGSAKCLDISAKDLLNKLVNETNDVLGR